MRMPDPNSLQRQPTDGMPQTAARPSDFFPLSLLAVLILSPLALVTTAVAMVLIQKQTRWRWYWFAGAALIPIGVTLAVLGPEAAIKWHFSAYEHVRPYVPLPFAFVAEAELTAAAAVDLLWIFVSRQVWLAVPGGLLAAALITYGLELATGAPNGTRTSAAAARLSSAPGTAAQKSAVPPRSGVRVPYPRLVRIWTVTFVGGPVAATW